MKNKIIIIIILLLTISNIYFINKNNNKTECNITIQEIKKDYDKKQYIKENKYYKKLKYKEFKKIYSDNKVHIIAITNSMNNSKDRFIEYVNRRSFFENKSIFLIIPNNFSKKNQAKFYNLNSEFKNNKGNYILIVKNNKILSKTTINDNSINELINSYN